MREKQGTLAGAPYWYGTPLDRLDFTWSETERLELEGYCRQIHQNIADSGDTITSIERLNATLEGREKDRLFLESYYFNPYAVRTLDPHGQRLKPGDLCRDPKLLVRAHMATVARYGLDLPILYPISYTQEIWGADTHMVDYGNPAQNKGYPIQSLADLTGVAVPDPTRTGLIPGYLWACREIKRLLVDQGLDKIMPLSVCIGNDPLGIVGMFMMGWTGFVRSSRKNPEFSQRSLHLATEWTIRMGQAAIDAGADCLLICSQIGFVPLTGNEWILSDYERMGKILGSHLPSWYALTYERALDWFPEMRAREAVGPGSFQGWFCADMDYKKAVDISRENDVYCCCALSDSTLFKGPSSVINKEMKNLCNYGKSYNKFSIGIAAVDYLTPQKNFSAAVSAAKNYGKLS